MAEVEAVARTRQTMTSSETNDHGTPPVYIELARMVLGRIDFDPFSSDYWNLHTVKASRYYTERNSGLDPRNSWEGTGLINPPSDPKEEGADGKMKVIRMRLVWHAWERAIAELAKGTLDGAIWIGFQLGQLQGLQGQAMHPLQFFTLVPDERIQFLIASKGGAPPVVGEQPIHANYITLLPTRRSALVAQRQAQRFVDSARHFGAVVRPL